MKLVHGTCRASKGPISGWLEGSYPQCKQCFISVILIAAAKLVGIADQCMFRWVSCTFKVKPVHLHCHVYVLNDWTALDIWRGKKKVNASPRSKLANPARRTMIQLHCHSLLFLFVKQQVKASAGSAGISSFLLWVDHQCISSATIWRNSLHYHQTLEIPLPDPKQGTLFLILYLVAVHVPPTSIPSSTHLFGS